MTNTHTDLARDIYNIEEWSSGYFGINDKGNAVAFPKGGNSQLHIDLPELIEDLQAKGVT